MRRFFSSFLIIAAIYLPGLCRADLSQDTLYATWTSTPSTSMTLQWISEGKQQSEKTFFAKKNTNENFTALEDLVSALPSSSNYWVHSVHINQLEPSTEYFFKFDSSPLVYQFKTAPNTLDQGIRFVVGGDMYHDDMSWMVRTCKTAASQDPLFALLGGDIAYTVPSISFFGQKIERWIDWFKAWHQSMITPEGNMIPVISAIGNHDIVGQFNQTPVQAAVFTTLFPMPGPTVYNVLDFENFLSLFILDSGHANRIGGKQTEWLQEALAQRQSQKHKFAIYHVPAYPSVRSFNTRRGSALRRYWVPLFEKYHVDAVFEHHDHAYKRTHPLIKNKIHSQGVVYLGDGAWGIEKPRTTKKKKHPPYIAKFASKRHFVLVDLSQNKQLFKSITDEGIVIDEYTRILSTFKQESESDNLTKL